MIEQTQIDASHNGSPASTQAPPTLTFSLEETQSAIALLACGLRRHLARQQVNSRHVSPTCRDGLFEVDAGDQTVISADAPILGV